MGAIMEMKIDDIGRVTIPKKIRHALDFQPNDRVEFTINEDKLELRKKNPSVLNKNINYVLNEAKNAEVLSRSEFEQLEKILDKIKL